LARFAAADVEASAAALPLWSSAAVSSIDRLSPDPAALAAAAIRLVCVAAQHPARARGPLIAPGTRQHGRRSIAAARWCIDPGMDAMFRVAAAFQTSSARR
jgi:hypothetical protein